MKKNNIYLATKLFSFYDRYASTNMYNAIKKQGGKTVIKEIV